MIQDEKYRYLGLPSCLAPAFLSGFGTVTSENRQQRANRGVNNI